MSNIYLLNKSPYNFFTSTISINRLIDYAKENNLNVLGLVETNTLIGALEFYDRCVNEGIKPIISLEIFIETNSIILTPKNKEGFLELIKISNKLPHREISLDYIKRDNIIVNAFIDKEKSLNYFKQNANNLDGAITPREDIAHELKQHSSSIYIQTMNSIIYKEEDEVLDVLNKLSNDVNLKSSPIPLNGSPTSSNLMDLTKKIDLKLDKNTIELPPIHKEQSWDFFESLCLKGLEKRLGTPKIPMTYFKRLKRELAVIKEKNFYSYFLIFYDIAQFCKQNNILFGPGRGSAPGSLVTYVLHITDLDPIENDLIFERFLNPMRSNLPDIDLDIEDTRRNEVVDFLFNKYGTSHVANITTYSTFGIKGAFREIAKKVGLNDYVIKDTTQYIPHLYIKTSLQSLLDKSNHLLQKYSTNDKIKFSLDMAETISSLPRHSSIHAAGIIMTKTKMETIIPIYSSSKNYPTTQWKMEEIEKWGISKLDLLGLRNLTILKLNLEAIFQNRGEEVLINKINLKDRKTFQLLKEAHVDGIFQLESKGMREVLKKIQPTSVEEIGLVSALYRPGAMSHIDECSRNKFNRHLIKKIHPVVDNILASTYGVLTFQEQVIQLMVDFASMSFADADIMRRVISKKDNTELEKVKLKFFESAKKTHDNELVSKVWSDIVMFAGYGFNKSHAISYAMISYWMAYLKTNYTIEFFCSSLTMFQMDHFKVKSLIAEARRLFHLVVQGPDINKSGGNFMISDAKIISPLTMIKGVGNSMINTIANDRIANGPYIDYPSTISRFYDLKIGIEKIKSFIKAGAFWNFKMSTSEMLLNLENFYTYEKIRRATPNIEKPIFQDSKDGIRDLATWEEEAIGINISRSVFHLIECIDKDYTPRSLNTFKNFKNVELPIVVRVLRIDKRNTKKGDDMLIMKITDGIDVEKVFIFGDQIKNVENSLKEDNYYKLSLSIRTHWKSNDKSFGFKKIIKKYNF